MPRVFIDNDDFTDRKPETPGYGASARGLQEAQALQVGHVYGAAGGPASSTDNAIVRFDGTTGKLLQDSTPTIDDNGLVSIPGYDNNPGSQQCLVLGDAAVARYPEIKFQSTAGNAYLRYGAETLELAGAHWQLLTDQRIIFRDPQIYIYSSVNGQLDIVADGKVSIPNLDLSTVSHAGVLGHEQGGLEADVSAYDGLAKISGGATSDLKCNWSAAVAPAAATDDITLGYVVGSRWFDTTADKEYVCLDNTDGAAVWTETTGAGGGMSDLIDDATPQLGGNLDSNGNEIQMATADKILFRAAGQYINSPSLNNLAIVAAGNINLTAAEAQVGGDKIVTEDAAQTLTNKSISGPQINSGILPIARIDAEAVTLAKTAPDAKTYVYPFYIPYPMAGIDIPFAQIPKDATITRIGYKVLCPGAVGTCDLNIVVRPETTPDSGGTDVYAADVEADETYDAAAGMTNTDIEPREWLAVTISDSSGPPTALIGAVEVEFD